MNGFKRQAAILIGILFLGSGLLKLMDPVGTMLIVTEWCRFFHVGFLLPLAKAMGIVLSITEAGIGIGLITGVFRKLMAILTFAMMGFFTVVTLILWILNPVMDCGCFGEAIHLTHFQSFIKNIFILALAAFAFTPLKDLSRPANHKYVAASIAFAGVILVAIYSASHLPVMEFTAFHPGTELYAALDDDASEEALQASAMLSFRNTEGEYLDSLAVEGPVVIFSVYKPAKADWQRLRANCAEVLNLGARPLVLAASYPAEIEHLGVPADVPVYYSDYKTLITLNRSNGGGTYFSRGELIYKWRAGELPEKLADELSEDPMAVCTRHMVNRRLTAQGYCVALAAVLILL